jgi:hypothetical protein
MNDYRVGVPVKASSPAEAAQVIIIALGADENSINDIGGLTVEPVPEEKQFLVCIRCGEAFDNITSAHEHGTADLSGSAGWCGDEGFNIVPESEAF